MRGLGRSHQQHESQPARRGCCSADAALLDLAMRNLYRLQVRLIETEASCSRIALRSRFTGSPAIAAAKSAAQVAGRQLILSLQSRGYFTTTKLRCSCERRRQYNATSADRTAPGCQLRFIPSTYAVCGKVRPPCTEKMATCKCCTRIHASCDTVAFQADVDIRLSAQADSLLICELDEFGVGDIFRSFAETL